MRLMLWYRAVCQLASSRCPQGCCAGGREAVSTPSTGLGLFSSAVSIASDFIEIKSYLAWKKKKSTITHVVERTSRTRLQKMNSTVCPGELTPAFINTLSPTARTNPGLWGYSINICWLTDNILFVLLPNWCTLSLFKASLSSDCMHWGLLL